MRKLFVLLLLFSSVTASIGRGFNELPGSPAKKAKSLKVMTYNVHHCNPPSAGTTIDVAAIAQVISKEKPDLVALQEVDVNTERSGKGLNQAQELARLTNMHFFFSKARPSGGDYGVAVLSRFLILDTMRFILPIDPSLAERQEP